MNCKRHRLGSRFVVRASVIFASWLAVGAVQAPAQEGLSHAEDPALSPRLKRIDAQSLEEAILLHRSEGSEANDVIDAFTNLTRGNQDAIIKFLLSLRLPLDPRYAFDDYR